LRLTQIAGSEENRRRIFYDKDGIAVCGLRVGNERHCQRSSIVLGGRRSVSLYAARLQNGCTRRPSSSGDLLGSQEGVHVFRTSCCHLDFVLQHHLQDTQDVEYGNNFNITALQKFSLSTIELDILWFLSLDWIRLK